LENKSIEISKKKKVCNRENHPQINSTGAEEKKNINKIITIEITNIKDKLSINNKKYPNLRTVIYSNTSN
jgi:hypothetical protein